MKAFTLVLIAGLLHGCAVGDFFSKTWEVIKDPSVPVGEAEDRPSTLSVTMNASADVNPNTFGSNLGRGQQSRAKSQAQGETQLGEVAEQPDEEADVVDPEAEEVRGQVRRARAGGPGPHGGEESGQHLQMDLMFQCFHYVPFCYLFRLTSCWFFSKL